MTKDQIRTRKPPIFSLVILNYYITTSCQNQGKYNTLQTGFYCKRISVSRREKFRIRYYNFDTTVIHLEKKSKTAGLCNKKSADLTKEQVQEIIDGDIGWMKNHEDELIRELYQKMTVQQLKPKTIVDYWREPFVYDAGNVRVTLDYEIKTGLGLKDFLNKDCPTVSVPDNPIVLEVKWDEFLPTVIRNAIQIGDRRTSAFSKYATCRIYD